MSLNFHIFEYMKASIMLSCFTKNKTKIYPYKDINWDNYINELLDECDEIIIEIYDDILEIV